MPRVPRKYLVDRKRKRRSRKPLVALVIAILVTGGAYWLILWDSKSSQTGPVTGRSRFVAQAEDQAALRKVSINQPLFSFDLPPQWKEIERKETPLERSITWQSKKKGEDNRWLKLYYDVIPKDLDVNRLLPIDVSGNGLTHRQLSDNCKNFTSTDKANAKKPQPSKWDGVDFICDLASFNDNRVGTGTEGSLNATTVSGPNQGTHKYFFVYTDRNIQPDYTIFYDAIKSFKAK